MASATSVWEIQEETKCPICLEYLTDPVTIDSGHNFCRGCITQYCETWTEGNYDPLCSPAFRARIQKEALWNNYQLENIVEKIKQLHFKDGKENLCERHSKALDLFCEEDGEVVCVVCERFPKHRSHPVLLMKEAAQKYKGKCYCQGERYFLAAWCPHHMLLEKSGGHVTLHASITRRFFSLG
ncbi:E3 ubiquitin-protein ligase TRIM31-like [Terrapene carolina triunguis]|uniref:E3 ubiquitin-protein ligase TRIM31-like n=1 Tax=Terrapene triunguis TaxID=2587831 RepID=UPI00115623B4|nr:E3 ubiquitin-protein ligase TRIM31-like [Terrapene carolina triunguis]